MDRKGVAPSTRCLQGSVAPTEHAGPSTDIVETITKNDDCRKLWWNQRESNSRLRYAKPALSLLSYGPVWGQSVKQRRDTQIPCEISRYRSWSSAFAVCVPKKRRFVSPRILCGQLRPRSYRREDSNLVLRLAPACYQLHQLVRPVDLSAEGEGTALSPLTGVVGEVTSIHQPANFYRGNCRTSH